MACGGTVGSNEIGRSKILVSKAIACGRDWCCSATIDLQRIILTQVGKTGETLYPARWSRDSANSQEARPTNISILSWSKMLIRQEASRSVYLYLGRLSIA